MSVQIREMEWMFSFRHCILFFFLAPCCFFHIVRETMTDLLTLPRFSFLQPPTPQLPLKHVDTPVSNSSFFCLYIFIFYFMSKGHALEKLFIHQSWDCYCKVVCSNNNYMLTRFFCLHLNWCLFLNLIHRKVESVSEMQPVFSTACFLVAFV